MGNLLVPPSVWIDPSEELGLITCSANSNMVSSAASLFNSELYSGTPTGVLLQHKNPHFGGDRALAIPAQAGCRIVITGATALAQACPALTIIWVGRMITDTTTASAGALAYVGTNLTNTQRAGITKSGTTANTARVGGRKVDGDTFRGFDVGGNLGSNPAIFLTTFNWATGQLEHRQNGAVALADNSFFTPGLSDNTASTAITFGADSSGANGPGVEMRCGGFHRGTYTTAEKEMIEGYLAHRSGLQYLLPADHRYKLAPP